MKDKSGGGSGAKNNPRVPAGKKEVTSKGYGGGKKSMDAQPGAEKMKGM